MRSVGFALLPLLLSVGCSTEAPTVPTALNGSSASEAGTAMAGRGVVRSVTGTAVRSLPDPDAHGWRTFTIAAVERQDGSVSGQFEMHLRQVPVRIHGRITCIGIQGNAAWLGGVIELMVGSFPVSPGPGPGTPIRIRVVDNGEGSNAPADLISGLGTFTGASEGVELAYCDTKPNQPALFPVEAGNIQVRD
jgi:hypothetical protein